MADWTTDLYETAGGQRVVEEEIKALGREGVTQVIRAAERLRDFGLLLAEPHVKHVEGKLWELRPDRYCVLYFATTGRRFVLLLAFVKKTPRTPRRLIDAAQERLTDYEARHRGE